jgi:serine/threonine protein kinase
MQLNQTIADQYLILDLIAAGGQALLAKGKDLATGMLVAIKQLDISPGEPHYNDAVERFKREGSIQIGHPNTVDPIAMIDCNGEHYIISPWIEGENLAAHVRRQGKRLAEPEATALVMNVAEGLSAAHAQGIVHRDIKPENIQVQPDGNPIIVDFGICQDPRQMAITLPDHVLGTLHYMAPEQVANASSVDHRSDLYSLGATYHFTLCGAPPTQGANPASVIASICRGKPVSLRKRDASIPIHVEQACMRLLAKSPDARFQSANEFIAYMKQPSQQASYCGACGAPAQGSGHFCSGCGAAFHVENSVRCLACGSRSLDSASCRACGRPFGSTRHLMELRDAAGIDHQFQVPEGIYPVGRAQLDSSNDEISRTHFYVACLNGELAIQDAGSTNKTYVGGVPADQTLRLTSGLEIVVAGMSAVYTAN